MVWMKRSAFPLGLRAIGFGEEVFDAELLAGSGEVAGAVGSATISEHALDGNPMSLVELDGLIKGGHHALDLLVGQETGKSQPGMIINGDVETFDSSAAIALRSITGGTHARTRKTAQLLDIEMQELSGSSTFVALNGRFRRFECREPMQTVTAQDAGNGGLRDLQHGED